MPFAAQTNYNCMNEQSNSWIVWISRSCRLSIVPKKYIQLLNIYILYTHTIFSVLNKGQYYETNFISRSNFAFNHQMWSNRGNKMRSDNNPENTTKFVTSITSEKNSETSGSETVLIVIHLQLSHFCHLKQSALRECIKYRHNYKSKRYTKSKKYITTHKGHPPLIQGHSLQASQNRCQSQQFHQSTFTNLSRGRVFRGQTGDGDKFAA